MKEINIDSFLSKKASDTIVIYGCGPSIKNLTDKDFEYLNKYDSMSFNMFCKTGVNVKYYIIGETLWHYWRVKYFKEPGDDYLDKLDEVGEDDNTYIQLLNNKQYNDTTFVVWDTPIVNAKFNIIDEKLENEYVKLKKPVGSIRPINFEYGYTEKAFYTPLFLRSNKLLLHQRCGLDSCIYLAKCMGYKKIIFCGVDLNNYKYAFDRGEFRKHIIKEDENTQHRSKQNVFNFVNYLKHDINFEVYNSDSALTEIINVVNKM